MNSIIEHQDGRHLCAIIAQVDGRYRLERRDYYAAEPIISFLSIDAAYRQLRAWRIPEGKILAVPGLGKFAAISE